MIESIEQAMRTLKLGGMAREWRSVSYENPEQYVTELLKLELKEREANRINRMVKTAGFRVMKTLDDFVWNAGIELPAGLTQEYMVDLSFLPRKENLIFMGSVGTGKTHLATAIALKACQEGRNTGLHRSSAGKHSAGEEQQGNPEQLPWHIEEGGADCSGRDWLRSTAQGCRRASVPGDLRLLRTQESDYYIQP